MDTLTKISTILAPVLKGKELTLESTFKEVGVDSIELVDVVFQMEEELGIQFEDEELMQLKTVQDLVTLIDSKK